MKRTRFDAGIALLALATLTSFAAIGCGASQEAECPLGSCDGDAGGGGDFGGQVETNAAGSVPPSGHQSGGDGTQDDPDPAARDGKNEIQTCTSEAPYIPFYLSADDSNSMASPILAREWLTDGFAPEPSRIRTYEFLNYYNAHYDIPDMAAGKLGVHAELQDITENDTDPSRRYRLQIGVQAFEVDPVDLVLTFVIDTSGSLVGTGMERARDALLAINDKLQPGDIVNVVTWSNENSVKLEGYVAAGGGNDADALAQVVNNLVPGGGSDLHAGLVKGYELAGKHFDPAKLNRVVLISDGGANLGIIDREAIADEAKQANDEGIYLVGIGVGPAKGYSDTLMDLVTDAGRGAYVYLDDFVYDDLSNEASEIFTRRFDEVMSVAARDVRVEVDLPSYLEIENFYGEEYSTDISLIEPQNLAPGDSMILNQTLYVTDVASMCGNDKIIVKVKWETPIDHEIKLEEPTALDINTMLAEPPSLQMLKANAVIAYAEALKKNTPEAIEDALWLVQHTRTAPGDKDLEGIAKLLALHPALSK